MKLSENELHYLGGVMDSDGSFYIGINKMDSGIGYRVRPKFVIEMAMQHKNDEIRRLFKRFAEDIGITFNIQEKNLEEKEKTNTWRFEVTSNESFVHFVEKVSPYLLSKQEEVEKLLSVDWNMSQGLSKKEKEERFMKLLRVREELRSKSANRDTKYTPEYFKEEFNHVN